MEFLFIICVVYIISEIILDQLKDKLLILLKNSSHKDKIKKMQLPKNYLKPFKKRDWSPVKYVFKRTHISLNDKAISKLCDRMLIVYLITWVLMVFYALELSLYL